MKLLKKEILPEFYERWDLEIENTHNFVAEGIVVHNTSAIISWNNGTLTFGSGGEKHDKFVSLFNQEFLIQKFTEFFSTDKKVIIYGEAAGGKQQAMSHTYGKELFFIAFEVNVDGNWLDVPKAEDICNHFKLEFVPYVRITTDLKEIDAQRDADSIVAVRKGCGPGKIREGVVLRPLIELTKNNGTRIIAKHKRKEFTETKTERPVVDAAKLEVLNNAERIADEWVTYNRLEHVLQRITDPDMTKMGEIIKTMLEDVNREGAGEFVPGPEVNKAISKKTAMMYKETLNRKLYENTSEKE
jgi:hypothetical protein